MAALSFAVLQLRALMPPLFFFLLLLLAVLPRDASALTRHDFPEGFIFGAGSSAYQRSESGMRSSLRPAQIISAVRRERASGLVKQASKESERSMRREVSAWDSPLGVSTEILELPWMRPSSFHMLCPCRTSTTRFASRSGGSRSLGRGLGDFSGSRTLEQRTQGQAHGDDRRSPGNCPGWRDAGFASASNQVEGAAAEDGRKPSIWDTFTHQGYSYDGSTADVSADQYHHYKEDVKLMHEMGLDAYRFSLSWPRLIPDGRGQINPKGLEYYNNLIDELILHGIQPHATINHFDLPQVLQDEYGGLLSPRFIEDYTAYAEVCFKNFGDRVKHWVTINEPNIEPIGGYDIGSEPPRRCSYPFGANCTGGNSSTEPYITTHHLLLAHASAVSLYREKYKASQGDQIGITLLGWWHEPATNTLQDAAAAMRMNDFHLGWFMHPLVYGDYPPVMRNRVGARLPPLTVEESEKVRGSFDFIGFNHYLIVRIRSIEANFSQKLGDYYVDAAVENPLEDIAKGKLETAPWSLGKLLEHLKLNYRNPPVLIHENGYGDTPDTASKIEYDDDNRSKFLQDYLEVLYLSIRNGSNARGYFVWSFLDVFEFLFGYHLRFGLCGIDMSTEERTRYVRNSARWYSGFLNGGELRPVDPSEKSYVE